MREAVIVSTARTPIGKAYRGAFNNTEAATLGGHVVRHAVQRAGLAPEEVEDVVMGCALPQGTQGHNIARQTALAAGLPVSTAGMTVDRQCSSGMMAIAVAARTIMVDNVDIMVGGGLESISLVQNEHMNLFRKLSQCTRLAALQSWGRRLHHRWALGGCEHRWTAGFCGVFDQPR